MLETASERPLVGSPNLLHLGGLAALREMEANNNETTGSQQELYSEDQQSHTSSLESLCSLENHNGSQDGSTSCSEDSFEMSSICSTRIADTTSAEVSPVRSEAGTWPSADLSLRSSKSFDSARLQRRETVRESIANEIEHLDTGLPTLDFDHLEKQLATAAAEREQNERKMLGEQVRRRLALQVDAALTGPSPVVSTRPSRGNLAHRLQTAMNLQVCYMNEMSEEGETSTSDSEDDSDDDDDECRFGSVPKSKSAPNLRDCSQSTAIKDLQRRAALGETLSHEERRSLLQAETREALRKAKEVARQAASTAVSDRVRPAKHSRHQLSKTDVEEIRALRDSISAAIEEKNNELVALLMEKDALHMQQDSVLVDIEDFVEHDGESEGINLAHFLILQGHDPPLASTPAAGQVNGRRMPGPPVQQAPPPPQSKTKSSRFRLFRR